MPSKVQMYRQFAKAAALHAVANHENWENVLKATARLSTSTLSAIWSGHAAQ